MVVSFRHGERGGERAADRGGGGRGSPVNPPAAAMNASQAKLLGYTNDMVLAAPAFSGLSRGSAGLYQVIATVPPGAPKDTAWVLLETPEGTPTGCRWWCS